MTDKQFDKLNSNVVWGTSYVLLFIVSATVAILSAMPSC